MRQIIFVSSLISHDVELLESVVRASFESSDRNHISGMLLYCDGNLMQALEGKKDAITETFTEILTDSSHVGIQVLWEGKVDSREFACWSFGYKKFKKFEVEKWTFQGDCFKATDDEVSSRVKKGNARTLLRSFFA